jgi:hypothetical protein
MKSLRPVLCFLAFLASTLGYCHAQISQLAELTASDGVANDNFGWSVAISGDTAVVGAPGDFYSGPPGAAYVFVNSSNGWQQTAKLLPLSSTNGDGFGSSVAIAKGVIVVGAPYQTVGRNTGAGAAHVFVGSGSNWRAEAELIASDGPGGQFGYSVAISGDTVVVGKPEDDGCEENLFGEAYVFVKPTGRGRPITETAILKQSDGEPCGGEFGYSVSIAGNTVVVGAPFTYGQEGTAYLFVEPAGGWTNMTQTAKLVGSDVEGSYDFAYSVAISPDGSTAVTGAPFHTPHGAAYVFVEPSTGWANMNQTAELTFADAGQLGASVALSGNNIVLAGAPISTVGANQQQGAAFGFVKPASGWKTTSDPNAELSSSDGAISDQFGFSVGVGGLAIVGAPYHAVNGNADQGAAYIFGPR